MTQSGHTHRVFIVTNLSLQPPRWFPDHVLLKLVVTITKTRDFAKTEEKVEAKFNILTLVK